MTSCTMRVAPTVPMVRLCFALSLGLGVIATACGEKIPTEVPLQPAAEQVEILPEAPNTDVYESIGSVSARVSSGQMGTALQEARNSLRNQAAQKGASFVSIDEVSSKPNWGLGGQTVVSVTGTAYRQK
jgi:hypothetical protein